MIKQLYLTVKGLCATVAGLTSKFDKIITWKGKDITQDFPPLPVTQAPAGPGGTLPSPPGTHALLSERPMHKTGEYRSVIRQEIKELREREKRKESIVVRGLTASTPGDIIKEFEEITDMMVGSRVTLIDVVKIPDHPELCRAKILDEGKRKLVLEKAKTLKGSRFDGVFIRRDLTYAQRQELRLRREKQNQEAGEQHPSSAAAPPPNPTDAGIRSGNVQQQPQTSDAGTGDQPQDSHPSQGQSNLC